MSPIIYVSPALRTAAAEPFAAALPLRAAPHSRSPVYGSVPSGARLFVLREQNGWCEVCGRACRGWVPKTDIMLFY